MVPPEAAGQFYDTSDYFVVLFVLLQIIKICRWYRFFKFSVYVNFEEGSLRKVLMVLQCDF